MKMPTKQEIIEAIATFIVGTLGIIAVLVPIVALFAIVRFLYYVITG